MVQHVTQRTSPSGMPSIWFASAEEEVYEIGIKQKKKKRMWGNTIKVLHSMKERIEDNRKLKVHPNMPEGFSGVNCFKICLWYLCKYFIRLLIKKLSLSLRTVIMLGLF